MSNNNNNEGEILFDTFDRSNYVDLSNFILDSMKSNCTFELPTILPFELLNDDDLKKLYPANLKYLCWKFPTISSFLTLLENKIEMDFPETYATSQNKTLPELANIIDSSNALPLFGIENFNRYINYCFKKLENEKMELNRFSLTQSMFSHLLSIPHLEVEKTWSQYCSFISKEFPDNYNEQISQIKRLKSAYDKNKSFVDECILFYERKLSKHKTDCTVWLGYLWKCRDSYLKEMHNTWRFIKLKVMLALFYRALFHLYYEGKLQINEHEALNIVNFYSDFLKLLLNIYSKLLCLKTSGYSKKIQKNNQHENETVIAYIIGISNLMITSHEKSLNAWLFHMNYINGLDLCSRSNISSIAFNLIRIHLKSLLKNLINETNEKLDLDSLVQLTSFLINFEYLKVKSQESECLEKEESQLEKIHSMNDSKMLEYLYEDIEWLVVTNSNFFFNFDSFGRLSRLVVDILINLRDYDEARYLCQSLISQSSRKSLWVWNVVIGAEKKMRDFDDKNNQEANERISNLYAQAFDEVEMMEISKCFVFDWLNHEFLYGGNSVNALKRKMYAEKSVTEFLLQMNSNQDLKKGVELDGNDAIEDLNKSNTKIGVNASKKRSASDDDFNGDEPSHKKVVNKNNVYESNHDAYRSTDPNNTRDLKRDRENLSVKIQNLPKDITAEELKAFFDECGNIIDLKITNTIDGLKFAIMEFSKKVEFLAALTKTYKKIRPDKEPIIVVKNENSTIYVSNFASSETEDSLLTKFKQAGIIRSIRFPSLKYNMDRRFCYIEYSNNSEALLAIEKFNNLKVPTLDYRLQVKLSDPDNKQQRSMTALETKREVFINNLNFLKVDQMKLENLFSKFGEIQRLNIPLSIKGRNLGRLNDGYAFITFKDADSAGMAVEKLNMVNFQGRVIEVSIAVAKKPNKNHIKKVIENTSEIVASSLGNINERCISILGLPDNINAQQLMDLLNEKIGKVIKLDLRALNGAALIEFETIDSAGKAGLLLNGEKINGKPVTVGDKEDFFYSQKRNDHDIKSKQRMSTAESEGSVRKQLTETINKKKMFIPSSVRRKKRQVINLKK